MSAFAMGIAGLPGNIYPSIPVKAPESANYRLDCGRYTQWCRTIGNTYCDYNGMLFTEKAQYCHAGICACKRACPVRPGIACHDAAESLGLGELDQDKEYEYTVGQAGEIVDVESIDNVIIDNAASPTHSRAAAISTLTSVKAPMSANYFLDCGGRYTSWCKRHASTYCDSKGKLHTENESICNERVCNCLPVCPLPNIHVCTIAAENLGLGKLIKGQRYWYEIGENGDIIDVQPIENTDPPADSEAKFEA